MKKIIGKMLNVKKKVAAVKVIGVNNKNKEEQKQENDALDISKFLICQKGITIYHVVFGDVVFNGISNNKIQFYKNIDNDNKISDDVDLYGKKYESGECLIFPSKDQRNWLEFKPKVFGPGDYVIIDGNKCIFDKFEGNNIADTFVAITGENDLIPNQIFIKQEGKLNLFNLFNSVDIRRSTKEEIDETDELLLKNGLVWNKEKLSVETIRWCPKNDEKYYSLLIKGSCRFFVNESKWIGNAIDIDRYENGNCFKTKEEANNWCDKFNNSSEELSKQLMNR